MFETNRAGGNMKPFLDAAHSVRLHVTYRTQIGNLTEAWRLKELDEKKRERAGWTLLARGLMCAGTLRA